MSTLVSARASTDTFVLAETFERIPTVEFEALRLVGNGSGRRMPLLGARGADAPVVREALQSDDTTAEVEIVSRRDRDSLFRVRWASGAPLLTDTIVEQGGAAVSAHGTNDGWRLRLLFPDHGDVSSTHDACRAYDVSFERIQSLTEAPIGSVRLTETQARTLEAALESGYYEIPRDVTSEELATGLDVSHQAASERLRRAHQTLVKTVLGL